MNTNRIGVIGIGRLGLSFALLCEQSGYAVVGYDVRADYVQSLNNRIYTTVEPMINEYLQRAPGFHATTEISQVVDSCDLLFCFVPTPSLQDGAYDHQYIEQVIQELETLSTGIDLSGKVLVIGCTVMPGYTLSISPRLSALGMTVAYNPEFIAQGDIINGLKRADMVLMGVQEDSTYHMLTAVYRTIMDKEPVISRMSPTAAEITKISINCFLTMKIAYANMIGEIAINSSVDSEITTILRAIGSDTRIGSKYLQYGFGYGGPCLPRDMSALGIHARSVGLIPLLQDTIDGCNNNHAVYLKNYYIRQNPDTEVPFLFAQLAYKPGTDMLVESQQYRLCKDLLAAGYRVDITESPTVYDQVYKELSEYGTRVTYGGCVTGLTGYNINI